jgi:hypothetical protein
METKNKKVASKSTTKSTTRKKAEVTANTTVSPVHEKMNKLETAYMAAISGEMKFGKVKSIFKQLHKEIKKSVKSKN